MRYSKKEDTLTRCTRRRTGVACFWYKKTKEKIPGAAVTGVFHESRRPLRRARPPLRARPGRKVYVLSDARSHPLPRASQHGRPTQRRLAARSPSPRVREPRGAAPTPLYPASELREPPWLDGLALSRAYVFCAGASDKIVGNSFEPLMNGRQRSFRHREHVIQSFRPLGQNPRRLPRTSSSLQQSSERCARDAATVVQAS